MLLIIEIALSIWAWNRGWKWLALLPLGIGVGLGFLIGMAIGASGGDAEDATWIILFDIGVVIASIIMIANPKVDELPENKKIDEPPVENKDS